MCWHVHYITSFFFLFCYCMLAIWWWWCKSIHLVQKMAQTRVLVHMTWPLISITDRKFLREDLVLLSWHLMELCSSYQNPWGTEVAVNVAVLWDMTSCSLGEVHCHIYSDDGGSILIKNDGTLLPGYVVCHTP